MKIAAHIIATLFGLMFVAAGAAFFFGPPPKQPEMDRLAVMFMEALAPSGYLAFVKACEIIGGALVIAPKTRNLGLLVLGPIVINILCFTGFLAPNLLGGAHGFITVSALFLLWTERRAFAALVNRPPKPEPEQAK